MYLIFLIVISILPIYYLGNQIYKTDHEKEPKKLLVNLFICGILSTILTLILTVILGEIIPFFNIDNLNDTNVLSLAIYIFIGIALIEEFSKWIFVYKRTYNHLEFNHAYDAIVYSVFVSLGFACLENCMYVFSSDNSVQTAILRSISAVPGHVSFGIFMGYYLGLSKIAEKNGNMQIANKNKILSLITPIILHGIYDYFALSTMFSSLFFIAFIIFVIWMFKSSIKKVNQLSNLTNNIGENKKEIPKVIYAYQINNYGYNFCPKCGDRVRGRFCRICGIEHKKEK